jgi:hypothetical protein
MRILSVPIAINFFVAALLLMFVCVAEYEGISPTTDFTSFYIGWSIVREGQGPSLYDLDVQRDYERRATSGGTVGSAEVLPYINPPHMEVPFVPLAFLSRVNAARVWFCFQLALLVCVIQALWRMTRGWTRHERLYMVSAILAFFPLAYTMYQGSFSLLVLLMLIHFYSSRKPADGWRAGVWLIAGTVKPQLVLLPGLVLVARQQWRALASAALFLAALVALSLPFLGWRPYVEYPTLLRTVGSVFSNQYGAWPATMANLKGLLTTFLGAEYGGLINALVYFALACAVALTLYLLRTDADFDLRFAFTLLLGLFVAPHLNDQDVLIAALPAVLMYGHFRRDGRGRAFGVLLCLAPAMLAATQVIKTAEVGKRSVLLLLIVLLGWAGIEVYRTKSAG